MSKISDYDVERTVWGEIVGMACGLEDTLQDIVGYHKDARAQRRHRGNSGPDTTALPPGAVECKLMLSLIVA